MGCKFGTVLKGFLLFGIVAFCLFEYALRHYSGLSGVFCILEMLFEETQTQWVWFIASAIWCAALVFLSFRPNDLPLIGLLAIALLAYAADYSVASQTPRAVVLLGSVAVGKATRLFLNQSCKRYLIYFLIILFSASACYHSNIPTDNYRGPRWTGLWGDPNIYGVLMGVGLLLSICLLAEQRRLFGRAACSLATGLTGLGLLFSCSRGAWCGAILGLFYLAWVKQWRLNRRSIAIGLIAVLVILGFHWHLQTERWYLNRFNPSNPSVLNRIAAWKGAVQIMRDHAWSGVGWNMTTGVYERNYSPPVHGGAAIVTNNYLMLGTQLGLPALLCFMAYVWFSLDQKAGIQSQEKQTTTLDSKPNTSDWLPVACRAGVFVLLVSFCFDGVLFNLPTAIVFWILLELGKPDTPFLPARLKTIPAVPLL